MCFSRSNSRARRTSGSSGTVPSIPLSAWVNVHVFIVLNRVTRCTSTPSRCWPIRVLRRMIQNPLPSPMGGHRDKYEHMYVLYIALWMTPVSMLLKMSNLDIGFVWVSTSPTSPLNYDKCISHPPTHGDTLETHIYYRLVSKIK